MRDFLLPLVLIVVVVAGVWIYFQASSPHAGPVVATAPISTDIAPPPPPKVAPSPKRTIARSSPEVVAPAAPAPVVEKPAAPPPPPPRPIPTGTPQEVNTGMEVSKVVELLGEPDLTALAIRRGNLSQTYIYKEKSSQNLAFIRLEGGRVMPSR